MDNKNKKKKKIKDPYMINPIYRYLLYALLALVLIYFSPKVIDFFKEIINQTGARAINS